MSDRKPLTRRQLHQLALRRRNDPDMKAVLWEIKRLRELILEAYRRGDAMLRYSEDPHQAHRASRFAELFDKEPAILEAEPKPVRPAPAKPETEGDRAAKRAARERR